MTTPGRVRRPGRAWCVEGSHVGCREAEPTARAYAPSCASLPAAAQFTDQWLPSGTYTIKLEDGRKDCLFTGELHACACWRRRPLEIQAPSSQYRWRRAHPQASCR